MTTIEPSNKNSTIIILFVLLGLCHSQLDVVSACLKGLGHIYSTGQAPGDVIFQVLFKN